MTKVVIKVKRIIGMKVAIEWATRDVTHAGSRCTIKIACAPLKPIES